MSEWIEYKFSDIKTYPPSGVKIEVEYDGGSRRIDFPENANWNMVDRWRKVEEEEEKITRTRTEPVIENQSFKINIPLIYQYDSISPGNGPHHYITSIGIISGSGRTKQEALSKLEANLEKHFR